MKKNREKVSHFLYIQIIKTIFRDIHGTTCISISFSISIISTEKANPMTMTMRMTMASCYHVWCMVYAILSMDTTL